MIGDRNALAASMLAFPVAVEDCSSMEALVRLATAAVAPCGMSIIMSAMLTGPSLKTDGGRHFQAWPDEWRRRYDVAGCLANDPLVRWAITSGAPARWSDVLESLPPRDATREVAAMIAGFGILNGVVTPVRTEAGHLGVVSVGGPQGSICTEAFGFLQFVSDVVLRRAEALASTSERRGNTARAQTARFSRRERESVALLVHGLTEREIAARLGVSEVTARFHLDNARHKVGARSRTHLAGIAGGLLGQTAGIEARVLKAC